MHTLPSTLASLNLDSLHLESFVLTYALNALWQAPLLFAAAWLAARTSRHAGPAAQHHIWVSALFLQVLLPACTLSPRQLLDALAQLNPWHSAAAATTRITITTGPALAPAGLHLPVLLLNLIAFAYAAAVVYFTARLLWGLRNTAALRHNTQPIALTDQAAASWLRCSERFRVPNAQLATSDAAPYPLTLGPLPLGIRRPLILLPTGMVAAVSADDLSAAFAHEFAHIQRHDFAKNLLYTTLSLPIAWHPIVWLTRARMGETREMLCDSLASQSLTGSQPYARSLLRLAALFANQPPDRTLHAIGIFDANVFERRVMNLTRQPHQLRGLRRLALTATCLSLGAATCASALALRMEVAAPAPATPMQTDQPGKPVRIGAGVIAGNRVTFVAPVYPPEAKAAKLSGIVVLRAVIGKDGTITDLSVISGPEQFRDSALTAVRQWVYKPYLLNGEPTAVDTTITVNYSLNPSPEPEPSPTPNPSASNVQPSATSNATLHIGGDVQPPILTSQANPEYSQQARDAKFSGDVRVHLQVDTNGRTSHIRVVKGVGMGLDEKAVEAVSQYRFKPATLAGKPVPVDLYIDVNFQML